MALAGGAIAALRIECWISPSPLNGDHGSRSERPFWGN